MAKKFRSKKGAERALRIVIYVILTLISAVWLIPFFLLILQSFRGEPGLATRNIFPQEWTFNNYIRLFRDTEFPQWWLNTFIVSLAVTVIQTAIVLATSYALSRLRFKLRKPLMNLMLILGMFPGFLSMVAVYYVLWKLNLTDNPVGLILVYSASAAMQYYICKGFFDTIPKSLDEAARIDGASRQQVFWKIILPLAKPIIIYTVLTAFIAPWGEYMFSSLIVGRQDTASYTVASGMREIFLSGGNQDEYFTVFCAAAVVVSIPITALFLWLQRYYVEGVTGGAVKG